MREIEERKELENAADDSQNDLSSKIVFSKSRKFQEIDEGSSAEHDKSQMKGSKVVMPEYVIGQKRTKDRIKSKVESQSKKIDKSKQLKLDHLLEEEEEDDEVD